MLSKVLSDPGGPDRRADCSLTKISAVARPAIEGQTSILKLLIKIRKRCAERNKPLPLERPKL